MYNYTVYWSLQLTWGIIQTLIGGIVLCVLFPFIHKSHEVGYTTAYELKWNISAGFTIGPFIFIGKGCTGVIPHEYGHTVQNIMFGPLALFIVTIPSVIRYWTRIIQANRGKKLPPYDSVWFEGQATRLGNLCVGEWDKDE